jgi:hypothetical protein
MHDIKLELKVCEGCGSLWVRHCGMAQPYCAGCKKKLAEFPNRGPKRPRGRRGPIHSSLHVVKHAGAQEVWL